MKLTLAFSPCPNDTFIFDALVNHKIDTEGLEFEVVLEDVETLNQNAIKGKYDISKISYGVYHEVMEDYVIMDSGSALGTGVGPLLIAREPQTESAFHEKQVAIPGEHTTAHFLFSSAYPEMKNKLFLRYDEIEDFVLSGKGLGVIIHENRFTYQQKGLHLVADLGHFWEQNTGNPIPLGGIVAKKTLDPAVLSRVASLIAESIDDAWSRYPRLDEYVRSHALEMEEDVMRRHINLYVNEYSKTLGDKGRAAVMHMLRALGRDAEKTGKAAIFVG